MICKNYDFKNFKSNYSSKFNNIHLKIFTLYKFNLKRILDFSENNDSE